MTHSRIAPRAFALHCGLIALLAAAALTAGCHTAPARSANGARGAVAAASGGRWIDPAAVPLDRLLDAPPADDSAQTRAEIEAMLQIQSQRKPEQCAAATADAEKSALLFAAALGVAPGLQAAQIPKLTALALHLRQTQEGISDLAKRHYDRRRPYLFDTRIQPCIVRPTNASYPSGHSTWGWLTALVLADMVPERRDALLERARSYGQSRVIGGVHYPSDVAAGRIGGAVIAAVLFTTPAFRAEEAQARIEVRTLLGLSP